jgi:chromosome segregation ATPase
MSGEFRSRVVRRVAVLALTLGVVAAGVVTVGVAADWRAESAPLDTAPVAMSQIDMELTAEVARADNLSAQVSNVALEVALLRGAVDTASTSVTGDTTAAKDLEAKLAKAKVKYEKLLGQLKAAQRRLEALNAAAARQAAINSRAQSSSSSSRSSGGDDHEEDEEDEEDEDDD